MFHLTKHQMLFLAAIIIGLITGEILKNFKIGLAIAIITGLIFALRNTASKK